MCIAIAQPAETRLITRSCFRKCANSNDDGLGMAWIDWRQPNPAKRLRILRVAPHGGKVYDVDRFWDRYQQVHHHWGKKSPIVIHFRFSTRGLKDQYNCHPFRVNPMTALIHNGCLPMPTKSHGYTNLFEYEETDDTYSDTWHYAHLYFSRFKQYTLHTREFRRNTEKFIGTNNKLVFLDATCYTPKQLEEGYDNLIIYNEKQGVWENKIWYSNYGFREYSNSNSCYTSTPNNRTRQVLVNGKWVSDGEWDTAWPYCKTQKCMNRVYDQRDTLCWDCLRAVKREEDRAKALASVKTETVATTTPSEFKPEEYKAEKSDTAPVIEPGGENSAHTDTKFYPPVTQQSEKAKDPSIIYCIIPGCTNMIPHRNWHYCQQHLDERVAANKAAKAKLKEEVQANAGTDSNK